MLQRHLSLHCFILFIFATCAFQPSLRSDDGQSALDRALRDVDESSLRSSDSAEPSDDGDLYSRSFGGANFRLIDLSTNLLVAAGASSERDEPLQALQGGGHDPRKRGFTLQNLELSVLGAVDPYLHAEVHLIYFIEPLEGESIFELEEAFVTSQSLPFGLHEFGVQVEAGQFFTEFGRHNPRHPHAWDFLDAPVVSTRFFGPDGLRGPGARIGWLIDQLPGRTELHLGAQNANGETMASFLANDEFFEERPIGGRPFAERDVRNIGDLVYLARLETGGDLSETVSANVGGSVLFGPNATGDNASTRIYGLDAVLKWRPLDADRGWPFVLLQAEVMRRDYDAAAFADLGDPADPTDDLVLGGTTLRDWGAYAQALWGFRRDWVIGVRGEYAGGKGSSVGDFVDRSSDPFRDNRYRVSPLLAWHPTEFSRLRLQYNYDLADHLSSRDAHAVWVGLEVSLGKHPAHQY